MEAIIREKFAQIMKLDPSTVRMDVNLIDWYGVDSLLTMRFISELEIALGIDIPQDDLAKVETLHDVVGLCDRFSASKQR